MQAMKVLYFTDTLLAPVSEGGVFDTAYSVRHQTSDLVVFPAVFFTSLASPARPKSSNQASDEQQHRHELKHAVAYMQPCGH